MGLFKKADMTSAYLKMGIMGFERRDDMRERISALMIQAIDLQEILRSARSCAGTRVGHVVVGQAKRTVSKILSELEAMGAE